MENFIKQPNEVYPIDFEFSSILVEGEIIDTYTVIATINNEDMEHDDVTDDIIDFSSILDTKVLINVKGGTDKLNYKITVNIITSLGNTYENDVLMEVQEI